MCLLCLTHRPAEIVWLVRKVVGRDLVGSVFKRLRFIYMGGRWYWVRIDKSNWRYGDPVLCLHYHLYSDLLMPKPMYGHWYQCLCRTKPETTHLDGNVHVKQILDRWSALRNELEQT